MTFGRYNRFSYFFFSFLFYLYCRIQLSLRENPLVVRFVEEISLNPPTLRELSARIIRAAQVPYEPHELPRTLVDYLSTAHCCVNPKCKGTRSEQTNGSL